MSATSDWEVSGGGDFPPDGPRLLVALDGADLNPLRHGLLEPLAAEAQPPAKVPCLGLLGTFPLSQQAAHMHEAFLQGLREFGYVEGQNLLLEHRYADGRLERIPTLAADLAVERPMKFELVINLKTAKALGLTIPPLLLFQADDWKLDRRSRCLTTI
jgi:hypothetical protein